MPADKVKTWRGTTVTFRELEHTYTDETGRRYESVSAVLKRWLDPFDTVAISERMQEDGKGIAEQLRAKWAKASADACEYGTRIHETAEAALQGHHAPHKPRTDKERLAMRYAWDFATKSILSGLEVLGVESMLFSKTFEIAGTADLICRKPDGTVLILDWKTNKEIGAEAKYGKTALGRLAHLPDCELTKYALQLAMYQRIIEFEGMAKAGAKFERMILHINPDTHESVKVIKLDPMQLEVSEILLDQMVKIATPF